MSIPVMCYHIFTFHQDNARVQTARVSIEYLTHNNALYFHRLNCQHMCHMCGETTSVNASRVADRSTTLRNLKLP